MEASKSFRERTREDAQQEAANLLQRFFGTYEDSVAVCGVLKAVGVEPPPELAALIAAGDHAFQGQDEGPGAPLVEDALGAVTEPPADGTEPVEEGKERKEPEEEAEKPPPAEEEIPDELVGMPALESGGTVTQRVETARLQLRILEDVNAHETVITPEVAGRLGVRLARARDNLTALAEAGKIRVTGDMRRREGATSGRTGTEYAPLPSEAASPSASAEESQTDQGVTLSTSPEFLAAVRDAVCDDHGDGEEFTVRQLADENRWDVQETAVALEPLLDRKVIVARAPDGEEVRYHYVPPRDQGPGRAAEIDAQRGNGGNGGRRGDVGGAAGAVEGTGQRAVPKSSHKETQKLLQRCHDTGMAEFAEVGSGHISIRNRLNGKSVVIPRTPRTSKPRRDTTRLRAIGLPI